MRTKRVDDERSAIEYIKTILSEWDVWVTHHKPLVQALEILLATHESKTKALMLKCDHIEELKEYIDKLHKDIEILEGK